MKWKWKRKILLNKTANKPRDSLKSTKKNRRRAIEVINLNYTPLQVFTWKYDNHIIHSSYARFHRFVVVERTIGAAIVVLLFKYHHRHYHSRHKHRHISMGCFLLLFFCVWLRLHFSDWLLLWRSLCVCGCVWVSRKQFCFFHSLLCVVDFW